MTPVLKHWTLSGILRARTGFPIDVVSQENAFGFGFDNTYRPDLIPGVPVWVGEGKDRRLNRDAFVGRSGPGSLGRNAIRGHGLAQTDLALQRRILVGETSAIDIRLETYNVFNQTNLSDPVRYLSSPLFGQSVSSANLMLGSGRPHSGLNPLLQPGGPRSFQVAVAFRF